MADLIDVLRLLDGQHSVADALATYRCALAERDADHRRQFAAFGIPDAEPWPASRLFHQESAISPGWRTPLDEAEVAELTLNRDYRSYPGAARVVLPDPLPGPTTALLDALQRRRSAPDFDARSLRLPEVAALLALGCGVTDPGADPPRRAAPSPGGLYPVETYVLALAVDGLDRAVYHYLALDHELEVLHPIDPPSPMARVFQPGLYDSTPSVIVVLTAVLPREQRKYLDRGYRFAHLEAGHVGQNLSLVATALSLASRCIGGFCDDALAQELRLDPDEVPLYCFLAGRAPQVPNHQTQI
jgi:SagB-type dehydrogenase family enzyme